MDSKNNIRSINKNKENLSTCMVWGLWEVGVLELLSGHDQLLEEENLESLPLQWVRMLAQITGTHLQRLPFLMKLLITVTLDSVLRFVFYLGSDPDTSCKHKQLACLDTRLAETERGTLKLSQDWKSSMGFKLYTVTSLLYSTHLVCGGGSSQHPKMNQAFLYNKSIDRGS